MNGGISSTSKQGTREVLARETRLTEPAVFQIREVPVGPGPDPLALPYILVCILVCIFWNIFLRVS